MTFPGRRRIRCAIPAAFRAQNGKGLHHSICGHRRVALHLLESVPGAEIACPEKGEGGLPPHFPRNVPKAADERIEAIRGSQDAQSPCSGRTLLLRRILPQRCAQKRRGGSLPEHG
jgi:hypothetical protein